MTWTEEEMREFPKYFEEVDFEEEPVNNEVVPQEMYYDLKEEYHHNKANLEIVENNLQIARYLMIVTAIIGFLAGWKF